MWSDGVGEDVVDGVFEGADGDAVIPVAFGLGDGEGVQSGIGVEKHLGAGHGGETNEFGVTAFVADDAGAGDAVDLKQRNVVARCEMLAISRGELAFGVAVFEAATTIDDEQTVLEFAMPEERSADEEVDSRIPGQRLEGFVDAGCVSGFEAAELEIVAGGAAFGKKGDIYPASFQGLDGFGDLMKVCVDRRCKLHLDGGDFEGPGGHGNVIVILLFSQRCI